MKTIRYALLVAIIVAALPFSHIAAKRVSVPKIYAFGLAASFSDSIVYFTDIQTLDNAWIDSKNDFLQSRNIYAYQLRAHLAEKQQLPGRTCIIFYDQKSDKLKKKYQKVRRLYTNPKPGSQTYDVRQLTQNDFRFEVIDLSDEIALEAEQEAELETIKKEQKTQKAKKTKKRGKRE